MADYRDSFTSEIYVNQSQAQDAVEKYTKKLADLNKQLAEIDKSEEGWEKKEKRLQKQIKSTEGSLKSVQVGVENYQKAMNSLDGRSLSNLIKLKKQLNAEIKKLVPGTQEYIRLTEDYKKVEARIKSIEKATKLMNEETRRSKSIVDSAVGFFNKYWSMFDTLTRTISGVSIKFRQCAEDAAKLDDVYADVMKTTGLLHEQVEELDKELMKLDTRTSREQLLLLARDAGKLGIQGKENILGFVRAADQIQVALGEDLGEGAIKNLGKIADVFGLTKEMGIEKSLLSIASAVNALGQDSTASEAYLVDFTQRLAGVGAMAGLSVQDILGFASGLDQSAMKVEMAATAFQKFLMSMYEEPAKFAKYAGMEVEAFSELLKTNANEAITTVMKAMNGQDGFAAMVPVFNEMGLDGARAVGVLSAMTQNLDAVTQAQALANVEFEKATSVTEEYNTKNNNMQAQLEKARKDFHNASVTLGQSLNPTMLKSTKATTYLIKALASYGKEIKAAIISIVAFTAAVKAKTIVTAAYNAVVKAGTVLQKTWQTIVWATRTAFFKLIGATEAATIAQSQLNAVMSASVFGVIALAVAGLTAAITHWVKKSREANEVNERMLEIERQADEEYAEQAGRVRTLTAIVENNNIALGQRKKALEDLKRIVPGYHGDLTEEGRLINSNKTAIDEYCKSLRKQLQLKAREEQLLEVERQIAELETKKAEADKRAQQALEAAGGDNTRATQGFWGWKKTDYGEAMSDSEFAQQQIEVLEKQAEKIGTRAAEITQKIAEDQRNIATEEADKTNVILSKTQYDYLKTRYDDLTKKEKAMVDKEYAALSEEESKALAKRYARLTASDRKADDKRYQERLKALEQRQREEQNLINQQYFNGEINAEQHEKALRDITMKYLVEKLELAKANGKDITQVEASILSERMKNRKGDYDKELKQLEARQREEEQSLSLSLSAQEITEKEYHAKSLELKMRYLEEKLKLTLESGQDETAVLQAIFDAQIEAEKAAYDEMKKLKEDAKKVIAGLDPSSARQSELKSELDKLEELHQAKILSEQEYEEAVKQLRKKYADEDLKEKLANVQKYVEQSNMLFSEASNFVTALKEAESAKLEAQYQADLTAAGDNAEERERIEAEYEQKKLDLQKKYADIDMAINIAKTIANGAAAAIKAYMEGGPFAGPVLAALIAATTAAEVATIIAQRNAIKNASVSSGGSSSAPKTGERKMTGYSEGGFTPKAASDKTAVGVVHANEYVAPAWMVRKNPVMFANLERYRKAGSHGRSGSVSRGFADGGFTGSPGGASTGSAAAQIDIEAVVERAVEKAIRRSMADGAIRAYLVRRDLAELDNQTQRLKNQTSR